MPPSEHAPLPATMRPILRVPWQTHFRRIFRNAPDCREPWQKHAYRTFRSLLRDPRYSLPYNPVYNARDIRRIVDDTIRRHTLQGSSLPPPPCPDAPDGPRRLFLDITFTARHNGQSGIQRVVRNIARQVPSLGNGELTVIPVEIKNGELHPVFTFSEEHAPRPLPDEPIRLRGDDVFLVMDSGWGMLDEYQTLFPVLKTRNVTVISIVYDLIPVSHFHFFSDIQAFTQHFAIWFGLLAVYSRAIIGISKATRNEVAAYLDGLGPKPAVDYFHLGFDRSEIRPSPEKVSGLFSGHKYNLLMVGTLEIRKDYGTALDAFELLRKERSDVALHIIGRPGWNAADVMDRIQAHPLLNKSLFWHASADDALLAQAYSECQLLVATSRAEGFGLPLIEAAQQDIPIVASNLPVFMEILGDHAYYFPVGDANALARVLKTALGDIENQTVRRSASVPVLSWKESGDMLMRAVRAHLRPLDVP